MVTRPDWMSEKYAQLVEMLYRSGIIPTQDRFGLGDGLTVKSAYESEWNTDIFEHLLSAPPLHARFAAMFITPGTRVHEIDELFETMREAPRSN